MIIYKIRHQGTIISVATNPKSGDSTTKHLMNTLKANFIRQDVSNYKKKEIDRILSESKNCALVFRDPYFRAVSMYIRFCFSLIDERTEKRIPSENLLSSLGKKKHGIDFIEFLEYLLDTPVKKLNPHYRPQDLIHLPHSIIRTEQYKKDMLDFFTLAGYQLGEALKVIEDDDLIKNSTSRIRQVTNEDSSLISSNKLIEMGKDNLPETKSFLNSRSKSLIEKIFFEELKFQKEKILNIRNPGFSVINMQKRSLLQSLWK